MTWKNHQPRYSLSPHVHPTHPRPPCQCLRRLLRPPWLLRPETYTYLDRLQGQIEALPVSQEVREAVVASEGIKQNPQLLQGEGPRPGALRGLLVVFSVVIASAGQAGQQAVAALRQAAQSVGRAS